MYCEVCGTQLPMEARACPNCGTFITAKSSASPHEATYISALGSSNEPLVAPPPPSTQYGSNPYEMPVQSPYNENPYPVPPIPPQRKISPVMLGIFLILVVLLVIGASVGFILLRNNQTSATVPPTATTSTGTNTGTSTASNTSNPQTDATATATAFYSLYDKITGSLPTKDDPLSDNSKGLQWDESQGCTFIGGAYHTSNPQSSSFRVCLAHQSNFTNFLYQVQMTIVKGSYGSLVFRSDNTLSNFYIFRAGQDGVCTFALYKNRTDMELLHSPCSSFKQGPNQTNLLAVIAQGSHLIFYVNAQYVYDISDASFNSGEIGLVSGSLGAPSEVIYNNAKIWTL